MGRMIKSFRRDVGSYRKPVITDQGYLKADAFVTRTGIFTYRLPDGTIRKELRPDHEVFNSDSLRSLQEIPITDDHPPVSLDSTNTQQYATGFTGSLAQRDERFVAVGMTITNQQTIDKIMSRENEEVSSGYYCDVELMPGEYEGERYDAIQKNIRYNHVAVVKKGRAGPEVRVKMDAEDAYMVTDGDKHNEEGSSDKGEATMKTAKVRIDSVEYEFTEASAKVVSDKLRHLDFVEKELSVSKERIEMLEGKCDARDKELEQLSIKFKEAEKKADIPDLEIKNRAKALIEAESFAKRFLGCEVKVDEMSLIDIKKAVVKKYLNSDDVDAKSQAYIDGVFDTLKTGRDDSTDPELKEVLGSAGTNIKGDSIEDARRRAMNDSANAWKAQSAV